MPSLPPFCLKKTCHSKVRRVEYMQSSSNEGTHCAWRHKFIIVWTLKTSAWWASLIARTSPARALTKRRPKRPHRIEARARRRTHRRQESVTSPRASRLSMSTHTTSANRHEAAGKDWVVWAHKHAIPTRRSTKERGRTKLVRMSRKRV